ncbi:MAG: DUF6335 family protein [Microcystaceae cyanobacterium]|nr:DUF6335 family protein [Merismopediaceae bacterium]
MVYVKTEENYSDDWDLEESEIEEILLGDLTTVDASHLFFDGLTDRDTGLGRVLEKLRLPHLSKDNLTGGDLEDDWYQAEVVGEEAVGGDNPTPDQNVTEDLLVSMGIPSTDGRDIQTLPRMTGRDRHRWELEPDSAEDYEERRWE